MKKKAIASAVSLMLVLLLAGCGNDGGGTDAADKNLSGPSADWKTHYETMDSMVTDTDLIVKGKVTGHSEELRNDVVFTRQNVEVVTVIKSDSDNPPEEITVLQTGGSKDGVVTEAFPEAPLLETGETYLLFLEHTDEGHYLVGGGYQGVAEIDDESISFICDFDNITREMEKIPASEVETEIAAIAEKAQQ